MKTTTPKRQVEAFPRRGGPVPCLAIVLSALLLAVASGVPNPAHAQEDPEEEPRVEETEPGDSATASEYLREVYDYPEQVGRDPFRPLTDAPGAGPRFEDLRLSGIVFNREIGSIAVMADEVTGRRYRVREGERLGDVRVSEIRSQEVVVFVAGVEGARREVMRAKRDREIPR